MLGLPNEMVWRTELSCGTVALLQSTPNEPPTGVLICKEHDDRLVSIVAAVRWDRHLAERVKAQRHAKVAAALAAVNGCPEEWVSDGNSHLCYLLGTPKHQHMCSCGAFAPESVGRP